MPGSWTFAATVAILSAGQGADPPAAAALAPDNLQITLLPGVWLPRLDGKSSLGPAGNQDIRLAAQLDLDRSEPTVNIELSIRKHERWEIILSGMDFSTDSAGSFSGNATFGSVVLNDGDPFQATFDITSVAVELSFGTYRPFTRDQERVAELANRGQKDHYIAELTVAPLLALRYVDVKQVVTSGGASEVTGGEWAGLLAGLQITLDYWPEQDIPVLQMLRLQGGIAVGPALGGEGGLMWQVRGGVTIQFTEQFGVMIGYRLLELDVETDDYALNGGLQGLFLAGSLRF